MRMRMALPLLCCLAAFIVPAEKQPIGEQQKVAATYFEQLTRGDVGTANSLATVPFNLDRKRTLKTMAEVREEHQKIFDRMGKRDVPPYTISVTDEAAALDRAIFPDYVAFRITIEGHGHLDIYVTAEKEYRVLGFSD